MSDNVPIFGRVIFLMLILAFWLFVIWRLRQLSFFKNSTLPSYIKCALLWAGIAACICLGFSLWAIDYELLFSEMNKDGSLTTTALRLNKELIYPVPLAALFGAAFGALFSARRLKGAANALKRGLVGAGLGLIIFLLICVVLFLSDSNVSNDSYGSGMLIYVAMLCSLLVPFTIVLALLTPKQAIYKNENV
jgi:hypothetical protein